MKYNNANRTYVLTTVDDPIFGDFGDGDTDIFDRDFLDLGLATVEAIYNAETSTP